MLSLGGSFISRSVQFSVIQSAKGPLKVYSQARINRLVSVCNTSSHSLVSNGGIAGQRNGLPIGDVIGIVR